MPQTGVRFKSTTHFSPHTEVYERLCDQLVKPCLEQTSAPVVLEYLIWFETCTKHRETLGTISGKMNFLSQHFRVLISILHEQIINILEANKGCNEILETSDPLKYF